MKPYYKREFFTPSEVLTSMLEISVILEQSERIFTEDIAESHLLVLYLSLQKQYLSRYGVESRFYSDLILLCQNRKPDPNRQTEK